MSERLLPAGGGAGFDCRLCGHCCRGTGGIVVSAKDLKRLCGHLDCGAEAFERRYGVRRNGKLFVRNSVDGCCVFFVSGSGCAVHTAKPDICRAWPYFRGNLVDVDSLELAKEFCPGIPVNQTHREFLREGLDYLVRENLAGSHGDDEACALQVADLLQALDAAAVNGDNTEDVTPGPLVTG